MHGSTSSLPRAAPKVASCTHPNHHVCFNPCKLISQEIPRVSPHSAGQEDAGQAASAAKVLATFAGLPLPGISFRVPPAAPEPPPSTAPPPGVAEGGLGPTPPSPTPLSVLAILNPLSRQAQRAGPLLAWLRSAFGAALHVVLNPVHELQKPPLDAYYRLVLPDSSASGTVCCSHEVTWGQQQMAPMIGYVIAPMIACIIAPMIAWLLSAAICPRSYGKVTIPCTVW